MNKSELDKTWLKFNRMSKDLAMLKYNFLSEKENHDKIVKIKQLVDQIADDLKKRIEKF